MSKSVKKSQKQGKKDVLKTLVPYFKLKMGEVGDRVSCKLGGYAQPNDKIQDEPIDSIDDNKKMNFGLYEVAFMTQHCNISGSYLVKNDKLPIFSKHVLYSRQFLSGNLFSCFLYFTLDEKTLEMVKNKKKEIKTSDGRIMQIDDFSKYYNLLMSGTFTMELLTIDDDFLQKFLEFKRDKLEEEFMLDYIDEFEKGDDNEKDLILLKINEKIKTSLNIYEKYFEPITIEKPRKKKIIQAMDDLFSNPHMKELINFGLKLRDKKRIEESCPDQTFEKPKKVINLKDLKEFENDECLDDKINEMLENCSDSDNSM